MAVLPELPMTAEQRTLCDMARRMLKERFPPTSLRGLDAPIRDDLGSWKALVEVGWTGLAVPEARGGQGCDLETIAMLMTEIGYGLLPVPFAASHLLCGSVLGAASDVPSVRALTDDFLSGDRRFALALLEPDSGFRFDQPACRGYIEQGKWCVSGVKCAVVGAPLVDVLLVTVALDGSAGHEPGMALFAVERNNPGVNYEPSRGIDSMSCADVVLRQAAVIGGVPIAVAPRSADIVGDGVALAILAVCWEAIGIMRMLVDTTVEHLRTRVQFGRPLGEFQVLQHRIADMYLECRRAESLGVMALREGASGDRGLRDRALSAAKARIGRAARFVGQQAVQLHGGMGVSNEHVVAHGLRRLIAIDAMFGNSAFHLERYQASANGQMTVA